MTFAWVDPTNTTNISLVDFPPPEEQRDGASFTPGLFRFTPQAPGGFGVAEQPEPVRGLYTYTPATNAPPGPYYVPDPPTYAFRNAGDTGPGTVGDPASVVFERRTYSQIPIDDLRDQKLAELRNHTQFVAQQSVRSTSSSNFWISLGDAQRNLIRSANDFLMDRLKDRTIGPDSTVVPLTVSDPTTYWARDISLLLIRDSNGQRLFADLDEQAWGQAMKDIGFYDLATLDADVAVTNDIDAQHTAGDWAALAAIDVTAASYGWPDYYQGAVSASIRVT